MFSFLSLRVIVAGSASLFPSTCSMFHPISIITHRCFMVFHHVTPHFFSFFLILHHFSRAIHHFSIFFLQFSPFFSPIFQIPGPHGTGFSGLDMPHPWATATCPATTPQPPLWCRKSVEVLGRLGCWEQNMFIELHNMSHVILYHIYIYIHM